jgi:hypothetical protein
MNTQILSREELKNNVNEVLIATTKVNGAVVNVVKEGDLFISGVTKVRDHKGSHQMMLEIIQLKNTRGGKPSMLAALNLGDDRFKANSRAYRVWLKITEKGFDSVFSSLANHTDAKVQLTGTELMEKTKSLTGKEILGVFSRIKTVSIEGEEVRPTINVRQFSAELGLPERIKKILEIPSDERSEQQDLDLESLSMQTTEGDPLVDHYGNQVYEMNEFSFGEDDNIIIAKMPSIEFNRLKGKAAKAHVTEDTNLQLIKNLID